MCKNSKDLDKNQINWETFPLDDGNDSENYIPPENIKVLLELAKAGLQSQIEGVRQIFSRMSTILTQAIALSTGAIGFLSYLISHANPDRPKWFTVGCFMVTASWILSAAVAFIGMAGTRFGTPGIDPRCGLKQDVLTQTENQMNVWAIKSMAGTYICGAGASRILARYLNFSIFFILFGPALLFFLILISVIF